MVESAVIGLAARRLLGEGVTAVVVAKDKALDEARCSPRSTGGWRNPLPKRVMFVDDLPRNAMGKVQKNVLRETYKSLYG